MTAGVPAFLFEESEIRQGALHQVRGKRRKEEQNTAGVYCKRDAHCTGGEIVLKRARKIGATVIICVAALYTGAVFAHGAEALEDDSCMRRVGENMIHLSVYQPQNDIAGHYCTDIPAVGNTVLVVDLVEPMLREIPVGIKLIRGGSEEGDVIVDIRSSIYEDGVINTQQELGEGRHLLVVTAEGVQPLKYVYQLRVDMINYAEVFRATIGPVIGLLLITLIGYKLFKSKRFKNWMAAKRKV